MIVNTNIKKRTNSKHSTKIWFLHIFGLEVWVWIMDGWCSVGRETRDVHRDEAMTLGSCSSFSFPLLLCLFFSFSFYKGFFCFLKYWASTRVFVVWFGLGFGILRSGPEKTKQNLFIPGFDFGNWFGWSLGDWGCLQDRDGWRGWSLGYLFPLSFF